MIVCPKCGYQEPIDWRNTIHQLYMQYLSFTEFEENYPELAADLKINPKYVADEHYAYHLVKAGYVQRQPKIHCVEGKWTHYSNCYEKPKDRSQKKLLEIKS